MQNKLSKIFTVLGTVMILMSLALFGYNWWEDVRAKDFSEQALNELLNEIGNGEVDEYIVNPFDEVEVAESLKMTVKYINGYEYIGFISIPDLDLNLPIMSEWDYAKLKISACRQLGTVKGNDLVLAAHNYINHFGMLHTLDEGAIIYFTDMDGIQTRYSVFAIEKVYPTYEAVFDDTADLTLYTCNRDGSMRIVVRCRKEGSVRFDHDLVYYEQENNIFSKAK